MRSGSDGSTILGCIILLTTGLTFPSSGQQFPQSAEKTYWRNGKEKTVQDGTFTWSATTFWAPIIWNVKDNEKGCSCFFLSLFKLIAIKVEIVSLGSQMKINSYNKD